MEEIDGTKVIDKVFGTSPDTVFSVLVGLLFIAVVSLCVFIRHLYIDNKRRAEEREKEFREERATQIGENKALQEKLIHMLSEVIQHNTRAFEKFNDQLKTATDSQIMLANAVKDLERSHIEFKSRLK